MITTLLTLSLLSGAPAAPVELFASTSSELVCSTYQASDQILDQDAYLLEIGGTVEVCQREVSPGAGTFAYIWPSSRIQARAVWGTSYATSQEIVDLLYVGRAKAAGNIYQNERIVRVCIWYTRDGVAITDQVCSNASSDSGIWLPGPEVSVSAWDILVWDAPKTIFNMKVGRANPSVF
jgi:hypothetical protein